MKTKSKKKVKFIIIAFFVCFIGWWIWAAKANSIIYNDIKTEFKNSKDNAKNAILIYQPSRTSFSEEVATDIAKGLNDSDYNVLLTTTNDKLTKDLSNYDLIIFGSPIYMSCYSNVIGDYIKSIENYGDANVVFYCTGMLENTVEFDSIKQLLGDKLLEDGLYKVSKSMCQQNSKYAYELGQKLASK